MSAQTATDSTFDATVLRADLPVIVDFWAPWCGPCRQLAPTLDQLAQAHAGTVSVVKVNTDENPAVAGRYGVTSLPMVAVFVAGEMVKSMTGAKPKHVLLRELAEWLS